MSSEERYKIIKKDGFYYLYKKEIDNHIDIAGIHCKPMIQWWSIGAYATKIGAKIALKKEIKKSKIGKIIVGVYDENGVLINE